MIDTIYFFASKKDLCIIFAAVEQEYDIKYCATQADKEACKSEMPKMEFDTINEIADDCHAAHLIQPFYLITPKNQPMVRYRQALKDRDDILEQFNMELLDEEIEIISNFMLLEYIDANCIRTPSLLKVNLSSSDFNAFSPANFLDKLLLMHETYRKENETLLSRYAWIPQNDKNDAISKLKKCARKKHNKI